MPKVNHILNDGDGRLVGVVTGEKDWSGDMRVEWIEGDTDGHEIRKEVMLPGFLLRRISRFIAKQELEGRLVKHLQDM